VTVRAERGWNAPIGTPVGIAVEPHAGCFFRDDGTTVVHRADRMQEHERKGAHA
jgi:hypothetical protein